MHFSGTLTKKSNAMQYTLSKAVKFEGKGLHTGLFVHMEVHPATINHGIVFRRVDLPGEPESACRC